MNEDLEYFHLIRLHKGWSDRFAILWLVSVVLLFGGTYGILDGLHAEASMRAELLIFLAVLVLTLVIWQAVGLGVARIHMIIRELDVEKLGRETRPMRE